MTNAPATQSVNSVDHQVPPRALYVHIPFCESICGYCDFYKRRYRPDLAERLIPALLGELHAHLASHKHPSGFETVFFGGGTPTTLPDRLLIPLVTALREHCAADAEFTLEANPATLDLPRARTLAAAGVNRLSFGAQSFRQRELDALDRSHTPDQIEASVHAARNAGISNLSLDLIFAIPTQTAADWQHSLDRALELDVPHLSCYGLTYEPGTPLHRDAARGIVQRCDPDLEAELFVATRERLTATGFEHYEISNYARPGFSARHNLAYWENRPALGIGPSACGYLDGMRYRNVPSTQEYLRAIESEASPIISSETLSPKQRAAEAAMLRLRTAPGIDIAQFTQRYAFAPKALFLRAIEVNQARGLIDVSSTHIALTAQGQLYADDVAADFLACAPSMAHPLPVVASE